jgi:hypothetical protein
MSSHRAIRAFARSLTLVPAALLLHIGAAVASDSPESPVQASAQRSAERLRPTADAQELARQLLLGVPSAPPTAQPAARAVRPTGDAQELARQLLLGITTRTPGEPESDVPTATGDRLHGDAQAHARQILLGRRDASVAD